MAITRTQQAAGTISLMELERIIREADPRVVLLPPRILRRVIKHDRMMTSLGLQVPHRKSYLIDASLAGQVLARDELGLDPEAEVALSGPLILLERPEPRKLARLPRALALRKYWRLLFHARVDLALEEARRAGRFPDERVRAQILRIGPAVLDEARAVLRQEDLLLPPRDPWLVYREFAAVYLELRYFAARLLPIYFPAADDSGRVGEALAADVDAAALFEATYLTGAAAPEADPSAGLDPDLDADESWGARPAASQGPPEPRAGASPRVLRSLRGRAERAEGRGNLVRAIILDARAAGMAAADRPDDSARVDRALDALVGRLVAALDLAPADAPAWREALAPLVAPASEGQWANEGRLLFDLQKACLDHEREIFTVDLVEWVASGFRRPIKRPLPVQADALAVKHLRSAAYRVRLARLGEADRARLDALLSDALHRAEGRLRDHARPLIGGALEGTDLRPRNVPERVAFAKVVEELLDQVVDRGYLTMGHLRDAIARNNLKLPDLAGPGEFLGGDRLLRSDHALAIAVDGVYRRGEVYLRWLQRFSSLGFGTPAGRFLTHYVVLPFGGAFVILKGVDSLVAGVIHHLTPAADEPEAILEPAEPEAAPPLATAAEAEAAEPAAPAPTADEEAAFWEAMGLPDEREAEPIPLVGGHAGGEPATTATIGVPPGHDDHNAVHIVPHELLPWATLLGGFLLMGLLHAPRFRALVVDLLRRFGRGVKLLAVDLPQWLLQNRWVRGLLETRAFQFVWRMVAKPVVPALAGWGWMRLAGVPADSAATAALAVFFAIGLFLSLRIGRDLEEIASDWLVRTWRVIRVNILVGLYQAIVDSFAEFVELVDRLLYTVDEWLRFRAGESRLSLGLKAVLGVVWFYVTYAVRFIVNLLVEPQINPIKHFPVVTVSHKVLAPILYMVLFMGLKDSLGEREAGLLYFFAQLLVPGVFGFLVWELKENFRLYQANQPERLGKVAIGHHGESMLRLLKPGLHSGTVPKLFTQLRHVERKALIRGVSRRQMVQRLRDQLHHVEESIHRFVDRELIRLLEQTKALGSRSFRVGEVELGSNRIAVEVLCPELGPEPAVLAFEYRSGWLVAGLDRAGWIDRLGPDGRAVVETSLAGFYHLAVADLITQDLEAALPVPARELEYTEQGLTFWVGGRLQTEVSYALRDRQRIMPHLTGPPPDHSLPVLESDRILLALAPVRWAAWVATWEAEQAGQAPPRPYLPGFVLLPRG